MDLYFSEVYLKVELHISVTVCTRNVTQNNGGGAGRWGQDEKCERDRGEYWWVHKSSWVLRGGEKQTVEPFKPYKSMWSNDFVKT